MNSMTGFGRGASHQDGFSSLVEISAVNRKQADVVISLPRNLAELETELRKQALARFSRGRLSITITVSASTEAGSQDLILDTEKAKALRKAFEPLGVELSASDYLRLPDILQSATASIGVPEARDLIEPALSQALDALCEMRASEGDDLSADLSARLKTLREITTSISGIAPGVKDRYREVLMARLTDIGLEIDLSDERILREIALFAERSDISEELSRLEAHFSRFSTIMNGEEPAGRPLDFLCQEINREFNTIGSKANDSDIAAHVVSAKAELEKMREQVQNAE